MTPEAEPVASAEDLQQRETASLLVRAQAGDRSALDEIIRRLMPLVWNVARSQRLDAHTAADVTQNVWIVLLKHLHTIHTPAALAGWLVTVTRRQALLAREAQRRIQPVPPLDLTAIPDESDNTGSRLEMQEQYRCLWRNLWRLSPRCQELLRMVAFVDRPHYADVSQSLQMPKGSIGPTRGRCLARLRKLLHEDPEWSLP